MTKQPKKKRTVFKLLKSLFFITIGAFITAFALESFLLPNKVIDGGIIGISMIVNQLTHWNLGLLIIILKKISQFPFIIKHINELWSLLLKTHLRMKKATKSPTKTAIPYSTKNMNTAIPLALQQD